MSNAVPKGWEIKRVGDIGSIVTGSTPSTHEPLFWGGNTPFVSPADFVGKVYIDKTSRTLSEEGVRKARLLPKDSILVTCIGSLGGMTMTSEPSVTNQQINAVVATEKQDSKFHFYNILFNVHQLVRSAGTTTLPIINKNTFSQINLLFPPLPEQQKIAAILSSVDEVIEKTRAQIDKLKDLKTGMMQELLTKGVGVDGVPHTEFKDSPVGRIPAGWRVVSLGSSLELIDSGWSPSCIEIPPAPGKWGVLKVSSVTRGEFLELESKTLPEGLLPRINAQVHTGDILLTRANGVAELVGKCVIVRKEPQAKLMMSDKILRLKPNPILNSEFLLHFFNSQVIRKQIELSWGGSSGQKNIGQSDIKSYLIPLPSLEEQRLIARSISQVEQVVLDKNKKLAALLGAKKALMQDLLTGKVRVNISDLGEATS